MSLELYVYSSVGLGLRKQQPDVPEVQDSVHLVPGLYGAVSLLDR
jgi:hypothetical protein